MIRKLIRFSAIYAVVFAAALLIFQMFSGSPHGVAVVCSIPPVIWSVLLVGWFLAGCFLLATCMFGATGRKIWSVLTGVSLELGGNDVQVNGLKIAFSSIMGVLLLLGLYSIVGVNVYTGYERESAGQSIKKGTLCTVYVPALAWPGKTSAYKEFAVSAAEQKEYFVGQLPPLGNGLGWGPIFLVVLCVGIARISIILANRNLETLSKG